MEKEKMKLSTAIREGAKLRPQGFCGWFREQDGVLHSCALGAAYEVFFGLPPKSRFGNHIPDRKLEEKFPFLCETKVDDFGTSLIAKIGNLNDNARKSREQIADYVESLGY